MAKAKSQTTDPIYITGDSDDEVVFSPADYDSFVLTQRQVLDACRDHQNMVTKCLEVAEAMKQMVAELRGWCAQQNVARCVLAPRMDDILVTIIARDDDEGGKLHDQMSILDLYLFKKNGFRLFWLLLRASEASGLSAFVDARTARTVFSAEPERASGSRG